MAHTIKRYSDSFRRQVVSEYETGTPIPDLRKKYGILGSSTISKWVKKFGKGIFRHEVVRIQLADEVQRIHQLEKRVKELEAALGKMTLEKLKLESILEVLQEDAPGAVKKNEPPSFNDIVTKSGNKANSK